MTDLSRKMSIAYTVMEVYKKYMEFVKLCSEATDNTSRKRRHKDDKIVSTECDSFQTSFNGHIKPTRPKKIPYISMFGESGNCRNIQNVTLERIERIAHITERHFKILANLLFEDLRKIANRGFFVAEDRLGLTLLYLAQGSLRRDLSKEHNLPLSTINTVAKETFQIIIEVLDKAYLPPSTEDLWKRESSNFANKFSLTNCVGVLDGRTFKTRQLKKKIASQNTKGIVGMCLLASCDTNYCFTACEIMPYRKNKVYLQKANGFTEQLLNDGITLPNDKIMPNSTEPFPYYFIGDTRFPLRSYLMTPYEDSASIGESPWKRQYNEKILNVREHITENTFGILRSRWKLLEKTSRYGDTLTKSMLHASILLHNYLIVNEDELYCPPNFADQWSDSSYTPGEWRQHQADEEGSFERCNSLAPNYVYYNGIVARDVLAGYFNNRNIEFRDYTEKFFMHE